MKYESYNLFLASLLLCLSLEASQNDDLVEEFKKMDKVSVKALSRSASFRPVKTRPSLKIVTEEELSEKLRKSYQKNMLLRRLKVSPNHLAFLVWYMQILLYRVSTVFGLTSLLYVDLFMSSLCSN